MTPLPLRTLALAVLTSLAFTATAEAQRPPARVLPPTHGHRITPPRPVYPRQHPGPYDFGQRPPSKVHLPKVDFPRLRPAPSTAPVIKVVPQCPLCQVRHLGTCSAEILQRARMLQDLRR